MYVYRHIVYYIMYTLLGVYRINNNMNKKHTTTIYTGKCIQCILPQWPLKINPNRLEARQHSCIFHSPLRSDYRLVGDSHQKFNNNTVIFFKRNPRNHSKFWARRRPTTTGESSVSGVCLVCRKYLFDEKIND